MLCVRELSTVMTMHARMLVLNPVTKHDTEATP